MKKLCCISFVALAFYIAGNVATENENQSVDCSKNCKRWELLQTPTGKFSICKCLDKYPKRISITTEKTLTKRDTKSQSSRDPIVGQSNPAAMHSRLINQRVRHRLHQQQQQQRTHLMTPPTHHRRLHHGHARQHHVTPQHHRVTPHHHPHLVGSVRERFGGGDENKEQPGGVLKRLRERQRQGKQEGGTKGGQAETKTGGEEKQPQQGGGAQIITQAPELIDERR